MTSIAEKRTRANTLAFALISAIIIFTTLAYGAVHQPVLVVCYLLIGLAVILWAADGFFAGRLTFSSSYLQLPLLAYALYGFLQAIPFGSGDAASVADIPQTISQQPHATLTTSVHLMILLLFFSASLALIDSATRIRRLALVITVFGALFAFFAILQGVLSPSKIYGIYERQFATPYGSFVNRHNFAAYMEMTIAIPLALVFTGAIGRDKRLLYITGITLMGVALLLSGSRGGLVALLAEVALLLILTTSSRSAKGFALKLAMSAALLFAVIGGAIFVGGESSLSRIAETAGSRDVSSNRTHIWNVTLDVITSALPFGAGIGAFDTAYTPYDTTSGLERVEQAHNDYLQVLADAGIPGLLIGSSFLFLLFLAARRTLRRQNVFRRSVGIGAAAGIFAILVHSLFDFVLHTTAISVLFLLLIAILERCGHRYVDDIELAESAGRRGNNRRSGIVTTFRSRRRHS